MQNYYDVFSSQFAGQSEYKLVWKYPFHLRHEMSVSAFDHQHDGYLCVESASDIVIGAGGVINANECGPTGKECDFCFDEQFAAEIGPKDAHFLKYGACLGEEDEEKSQSVASSVWCRAVPCASTAAAC